MWYAILADALVLVHLAFIIFALFGGLLVLKWQYVICVHVPAVLWAAWVEYQGWICPLTPLENWFRQKAGMGGYQEGFIEHYLIPLLYPAGLTRGYQMVLGTIVLLLNGIIYAWVLRHRTHRTES